MKRALRVEPAGMPPGAQKNWNDFGERKGELNSPKMPVFNEMNLQPVNPYPNSHWSPKPYWSAPTPGQVNVALDFKSHYTTTPGMSMRGEQGGATYLQQGDQATQLETEIAAGSGFNPVTALMSQGAVMRTVNGQAYAAPTATQGVFPLSAVNPELRTPHDFMEVPREQPPNQPTVQTVIQPVEVQPAGQARSQPPVQPVTLPADQLNYQTVSQPTGQLGDRGSYSGVPTQMTMRGQQSQITQQYERQRGFEHVPVGRSSYVEIPAQMPSYSEIPAQVPTYSETPAHRPQQTVNQRREAAEPHRTAQLPRYGEMPYQIPQQTCNRGREVAGPQRPAPMPSYNEIPSAELQGLQNLEGLTERHGSYEIIYPQVQQVAAPVQVSRATGANDDQPEYSRTQATGGGCLAKLGKKPESLRTPEGWQAFKDSFIAYMQIQDAAEEVWIGVMMTFLSPDLQQRIRALNIPSIQLKEPWGCLKMIDGVMETSCSKLTHRVKLMTMTQGEQTLLEFANELRKVAKAGDFGTGEAGRSARSSAMLTTLICGIKDQDITFEILKVNPGNFEEALALASTIETAKIARQQTGQAMRQDVLYEIQASRQGREETAHLIDKQAKVIEELKTQLSNLQQQQQDRRKVGGYREYNRDGDFSHLECHHCHVKGHIRPYCPLLKKEEKLNKRGSDEQMGQRQWSRYAPRQSQNMMKEHF